MNPQSYIAAPKMTSCRAVSSRSSCRTVHEVFNIYPRLGVWRESLRDDQLISTNSAVSVSELDENMRHDSCRTARLVPFCIQRLAWYNPPTVWRRIQLAGQGHFGQSRSHLPKGAPCGSAISPCEQMSSLVHPTRTCEYELRPYQPPR